MDLLRARATGGAVSSISIAFRSDTVDVRLHAGKKAEVGMYAQQRVCIIDKAARPTEGRGALPRARA